MAAPQHTLADFVTDQWQRRSWFAWLMWPLSLLFGLIARIRRYGYQQGWFKSTRLPMPVIVVGNVTVGGTGKTPAVIALAHALAEAGLRPGVVSRGYGVKLNHPRRVKPTSKAADVGDEPLLIARAADVPVWVFPDRALCAQAMLVSHPGVNVLLLDDGLQHYKLQRDFEIVMFDTRMGGNGMMLPAGPLREPLTRPRDATLINDPNFRATPDKPDVYGMRLELDEAWQLNDPTMSRDVSKFADKRVLAAASRHRPPGTLLRQPASGGALPRHDAAAGPLRFRAGPVRGQSCRARSRRDPDHREGCRKMRALRRPANLGRPHHARD